MKFRQAALMTFLLLGFLKFVIAQNSDHVKDIAPKKENICFELTFKPFVNDKIIELTGLRSKYFISSDFALRAAFHYKHKDNNFERQINITINSIDTIVMNKYRMDYNIWNIQFGFEYRLQVKGIVFPYFGVDFGFERKNSEYLREENDWSYIDNHERYLFTKTTTVENGWLFEENIYTDGLFYYKKYSINEQAYNSFTINMFFGLDIYIIKNLYAGFEIGLYVKSKYYLDAVLMKNDEDPTIFHKFKDIEPSFNTSNLIRVGFWL